MALPRFPRWGLGGCLDGSADARVPARHACGLPTGRRWIKETKSLISKGISEFTFGFEIGYLMPLGKMDQRFKPTNVEPRGCTGLTHWPTGQIPEEDTGGHDGYPFRDGWMTHTPF